MTLKTFFYKFKINPEVFQSIKAYFERMDLWDSIVLIVVFIFFRKDVWHNFCHTTNV